MYKIYRDQEKGFWWVFENKQEDPIAVSIRYYPTRKECDQDIEAIKSDIFADVADLSEPPRPRSTPSTIGR